VRAAVRSAMDMRNIESLIQCVICHELPLQPLLARCPKRGCLLNICETCWDNPNMNTTKCVFCREACREPLVVMENKPLKKIVDLIEIPCDHCQERCVRSLLQ